MTAQDYSASITANITAEEATERINRVADWWTAGFTGASEKIGDTFTVRFGETFVHFAVVELVPAKRIVWRVTDCNLQFIEDKKEWKNTEVVFDISSDDAATTVTMTHSGLEPGVECYETCRKGWNFFITESLQKLLTENQGMPDRVGRRESAEEVVAEEVSMAKGEIWHELLVNTSPEQLYEAVAKVEGLAHWWTTGVRGESAVGKRLEFWFGSFCASIAEITMLKPGELVRWHITGGAATDWLDTDIEFKIFRDSDRTFLHFRHSNWREDAKQFPHCSMGWAIFLLSLKEFAEAGKGRPYPYDMPVNMWTPPTQVS